MRFHIIRNARIENVGKSQSCMVSKLRIVWKQTVLKRHPRPVCGSPVAGLVFGRNSRYSSRAQRQLIVQSASFIIVIAIVLLRSEVAQGQDLPYDSAFFLTPDCLIHLFGGAGSSQRRRQQQQQQQVIPVERLFLGFSTHMYVRSGFPTDISLYVR